MVSYQVAGRQRQTILLLYKSLRNVALNVVIVVLVGIVSELENEEEEKKGGKKKKGETGKCHLSYTFCIGGGHDSASTSLPVLDCFITLKVNILEFVYPKQQQKT